MAIDLNLVRRELLALRQALIAEDTMAAAERAPIELDQESVGRLSRIDAMQVQAMALAQARRRQAKRGAIDAALARIDEGEFGYCVKCGEAIASARLVHDPAAATCITCAG